MIEAIIAGLLMSELADIVGFPLFDRVVEIWLPPVVLGIGGAVAASWTHGPEGSPVNAQPPKPKEQSMTKRQGFAFAVILVYLWVMMILLGAIVLETFMVYPNIFHDPPVP